MYFYKLKQPFLSIVCINFHYSLARIADPFFPNQQYRRTARVPITIIQRPAKSSPPTAVERKMAEADNWKAINVFRR